MYPFEGDEVFARDCWYVAALRSEVGRDPLERTICDEPMLLYRTEAGQPVAMYGLCPHRYFPLAMGRLVGDAIECGYHGFTFDRGGKCVRMPAQDGKGAGFVQRTYPVAEHGPWLWVWPGEPSRADTGKLPRLEPLGLAPDGAAQEGWTRYVDPPRPFKARSQLLVDNLLDLTHVTFLHGAMLDTASLVRARMSFEELDHGGLLITRHVTGVEWDGYWDFHFLPENRFAGRADYVLPTYYLSPGLIATAGFQTVRVDGRSDVPAALGRFKYIHALTPSTRHSGLYFFAQARNIRLDDAAFDAVNTPLTNAVIQQDIVAVEAMEPRIDQAAAVQPELLSRADRAAIEVRRRIQRMIDAEGGERGAGRRPAAAPASVAA